MRLTRIVLAIGLSLPLAAAACGGKSPTAPTPPVIPPGTHQSALSPVLGTGTGGVSVSPKSNASGTFAADIAVSLANGKPNTTYIVQRAPEVGRALGSDGICQRAAGISPWSPADPPAPAFLTFQVPNPGPNVTFTTSAQGSGTIGFEFLVPIIPAGTVFDVMLRLVDNETAPTLELRSGCLTVIAK